MEPLRGFAEFLRAAAVAQQQFPNLHVVVLAMIASHIAMARTILAVEAAAAGRVEGPDLTRLHLG